MSGFHVAHSCPPGGDHRARPSTSLLNEKPVILLDGSREYSLRKHPVAPRHATDLAPASGLRQFPVAGHPAVETIK
jgi:hypothetical protein